MAVNLSPIWGAGAQLLDNSGNVLSGGKIYTYAAGTTTPATTYTSSNGITANSNPIILNSAGRVPYEIWLSDTVAYKFVLKDSNDTLIATYDNLVGINSNYIAYTAQQEIQTATAGQTVFNLTTMQYQPGTNNLSVFVDGVNQYGPGAQYAYVETDSDTVTFVSGLHVNASVKFTTASPVAGAVMNAENVAYDPPFTGAVGTNVEAKLAQTVSVKDFGAVGDGVTDDYAAFVNADADGSFIIPPGVYKIDSDLTLSNRISFAPGASLLPDTGVTITFAKGQENITPQMFGAIGDNSTDDSVAFQNAFNSCGASQTALYIPEAAYVFGSQIVANNSFDIKCDKTAAMRWTDQTDCGILFDFQDAQDSLCEINLPQLFSAGINSSFQIPGYGPSTYTYNLNARYGNAVYLKGGNRINLSVHYIVGWHSGVLVGSTASSVLANVNIDVNTIDFCVKGIAVFSSEASSKGVSEVVFNANTVWAKYPIFLDGTYQYIIGSQFNINGSAYVNEPDGSTIYASHADYTSVDTCKFTVNRAASGYGADSTTGVSTSLICPFIAGDGSSNGVTTDGNATVGYFKGHYCEFEIGPVMGIDGSVAGASPVPVAGDTIRVRDGGEYNHIRMRYSDNIATTPIPVTATIGEANYNGGVGGAQYSNKVYCSASMPSLPATNSTVFYMYHQCVAADQTKPIKIYPRDTSLFQQHLQAVAYTDAATNNRQIKIEIANLGTTTSAGGTIDFWVELP